MADHADDAPTQLYSRRMARKGQDNRMLHTAPHFLLLSIAPLYTHTPGELGQQVSHTQYSPHQIHYHLFHWSNAMGQKLQRGLSVGVATTRPPRCETQQNSVMLVEA